MVKEKQSYAVNRCQRCNRELKDQNARYGWRCAEIMGVSAHLNNSGDKAFNAYMQGIRAADKFLRDNYIDTGKIDLIKFLTAYTKQYIALSMNNRELWQAANDDKLDALNPPKDKDGRFIYTEIKSPSLDDYIRITNFEDSNNITQQERKLHFKYTKKWDIERLNDEDFLQVQALSLQWQELYITGDTFGMIKVHNNAEAIRDKYRYADEVGTGDGNTIVKLKTTKVYDPYSKFTSQDNAAIAFGITYNDVLQEIDPDIEYNGKAQHGIEMGAYIYKVVEPANAAPYYTFGDPYIGGHDNVIKGLITHINENIPVPGNSNVSRTGMVHFHPACDCHDNFSFSGPDIWFSKTFNMTVYITYKHKDTQNFEVKRHDSFFNEDRLIWE